MAGAGQPWYMPLTWPIGHVATALKIEQATSNVTRAPTPTATSSLDLIGHLTSFAAATRSFLLAMITLAAFYF